MIITADYLRSKNACGSQVDLFLATFGESVNITPAICLAVADKFDWGWAAEHLLTAPAWAEYQRIKAPAWAEYQRIKAPAWAEYQRIKAPAWAEYRRIEALAWAECWNTPGGMGEGAK